MSAVFLVGVSKLKSLMSRLNAIVSALNLDKPNQELENEIRVVFDDTLAVLPIYRDRASWGEVRKELEKIREVFSSASELAASIFTADRRDPKFVAYQMICDADHNFSVEGLPKLKRIKQWTGGVSRLSDKLIQDYSEEAKSAGRPDAGHFRRLICGLHEILSREGLRPAIKTDRETNERASAFWAVVIDTYSTLAGVRYAGLASHQAALEHCKKQIIKLSAEAPE